METNGFLHNVLKEEPHTVIELGSLLEARKGLFPGHAKRKQLYVNSLTSMETESLTALCETLLPSVAVPDDSDLSDSVAEFYRSSASMTGTPDCVGGLIAGRLVHPKKFLIRLVLWMLSTWIGTLILCGTPSISLKFPFVRRFSQVPPEQREKIVHSWSLSCFPILRTWYNGVKLLVLFAFFTQVDEKNVNLAWKAIGYPGPDPQFGSETNMNQRKAASIGSEYDEKDEHFGPLFKGLLNLNLPRDVVAEKLSLSGFPVSIGGIKGSSSEPYLVIKCDAIVVGSGSGGGVAAGILAKAGYKVLVLEKGNYFARTNLSLAEGPAMDQMYLSGGLVGTDDLGLVVFTGSTVGGGSTINWSASIPTPQHVLKEWGGQYGLELFESKLYREALNAVCEKMGVQSEVDDEGFNNEILRKGCQELGYPVVNIPRNATPDHYCGWCSLGCKDGRKKGTNETWLVDLVNSGNGLILPGCEAVKVLHKQQKGSSRKKATGVAFQFDYRGKKDLCVVESKVTIVACGALATPSLLKRSGLKNQNIGKNLHLHPVTMAWGYFPDTMPASDSWPEKRKKSYEGGIMTAMSTVVGNFDKSGYGAVIQTPSLHPGMFSAVMPWVSGAEIKKRMCRFPRTAHIFALARDKGSGTVNAPTTIKYRMEAEDEEHLQKGLEKVLRILAAAGAEEIGTQHCNGRSLNVKKASYREFERFVKEESSRPLRDLSTEMFSAHQMGSCRMGIGPKDSVVNQMGETWELEGLFLADTSVFPTALGVNPMVTVQAISYCTAKSIVEVLRRKKATLLPY